ncbi:MAG: Flp pilus assembly complex ATPase component TadA [Planctomycetia bacterium]|nr:Flp pilus assembly complex ATPase component TadA [Planctomycetia bacterium]
MATPNQPNNPNQPKKPAEKTGDAANKPTNKPTGSGNGQPTPSPKPTPPAGQTGGQKPTQGTPGNSSAKTPPLGTPAAKPSATGSTGSTGSKPGSTPVSKPGQPPSAKQPAQPAKPAQQPAKKPQPAKNRFAHIDANTLQLAKKLEDLGFLDGAQIDSIYEEMRTSDARLGEIAMQRGLLTEEQLLQATAEIHGMRVANLEDVKPQPAAIKLVPKQMAELYKLVPLNLENEVLTVAMADPNNLQAMDDLRNLLPIRGVNPVLGPPKQIDALLARAYSNEKEETISSVYAEIEADSSIGSASTGREHSIDLTQAEEIANSAPVRKLINMVLLMAIRDHSSDVHFEPFEDEYKMRYRCDGVLYEMVPPPRHLATAIASRIKVMANLDIAERRLPQDGRIELNVGGNPVDMRVSVLPTLFGESVVIRVLDRTNVGLSLDRIGMPTDLLSQFRAVIKKPNGIVLVTGPTGAGKTTTLYSGLSELNDIDVKIITTEDPVEYEIDGIIQCPINHEIDLTFASALRSILRQDPDIILVGEIRDLETAQIAIQASLTGHLVFSTLHTNDAPSSITRLRDMGVEPYLITATVEAIQAQRLVRRICMHCKTPYEPTREQLMELNLTPEQMKGRQFFYGEGCDKCNNLGFKGRTGLYEILIMSDDVRDMVSRGASTDAIRQYTRKQGTPSLRDAGLRALFGGITTLDEVVRETVQEDDS